MTRHSPGEERVTKAKAKARPATKARARAAALSADAAGAGPRDLLSSMRTQRRRNRRKTKAKNPPQGIDEFSARLPGQAGGVPNDRPGVGPGHWAEGDRELCRRQEGPRPGRTLLTSSATMVKTKLDVDTEKWERPDPGSTEDQRQPRADMPDDAIEMQTPGVGTRGERLRLMRGAAIPVLPEPDPAPGIPHWDTMSDLELLRRALGEDRHAPGAQIMEALRVRIEQKKKNLAFTWKNSYLAREVAIRIDVKVTPNDSQVFLDDQLRAAEQRTTTWGLLFRDEERRWRSAWMWSTSLGGMPRSDRY